MTLAPALICLAVAAVLGLRNKLARHPERLDVDTQDRPWNWLGAAVVLLMVAGEVAWL